MDYNKSNNKILRLAFAMALTGMTWQASAGEVSMADARFLKIAAFASHYEMEGSKLALKKSKNAEVQKFAQLVVDEHIVATEELKALASQKEVEVPTEPNFMQKGSLLLLDRHEGRDFDAEYAEHIGVDAHEATVELFEHAAKTAEDDDIKQFANRVLPTLTHHFEMAKALNNILEIK